jgi:hypothetical protein
MIGIVVDHNIVAVPKPEPRAQRSFYDNQQFPIFSQTSVNLVK